MHIKIVLQQISLLQQMAEVAVAVTQQESQSKSKSQFQSNDIDNRLRVNFLLFAVARERVAFAVNL